MDRTFWSLKNVSEPIAQQSSAIITSLNLVCLKFFAAKFNYILQFNYFKMFAVFICYHRWVSLCCTIGTWFYFFFKQQLYVTRSKYICLNPNCTTTFKIDFQSDDIKQNMIWSLHIVSSNFVYRLHFYTNAYAHKIRSCACAYISQIWYIASLVP